jgi:hypothetical protein
MSPEVTNKNKKPAVVAKPTDVRPGDAPERVRKPHYDWEHESQDESEAPRAKSAATLISAWKENVEAWIKRNLLLAESSFGDRDDGPTPA